MNQPDKIERIKELSLGQLDGNLDDEQFEELSRFLANDPDARDVYVRFARLDADLRDAEFETSDAGDARHVRTPRTGLYRSTIIAFGIALAGAVLFLVVDPWSEPRPTNDGASNNRPTSEVATNDGSIDAFPMIASQATRGIAVISAQANAVWETEDSMPIGEGSVLGPSTVILREGLAQIDFFGGASVSLASPVELALVSRDAAVLHRGRLRAEVPPAARGFEVRAADVRLEDLGTTFGISAERDSQAEIIVFSGEVRTHDRDGMVQSLLEGDAARLENGKTVQQASDELGDFPDLSDVVDKSGGSDLSRYQTWKRGSMERRNDPRLIAYFDFEALTPSSRRLANRATHGGGSELDGGIVGARIARGRWSQKPALDFRREGDRVRFVIPGEYDTITLFAWVRIDALDRNLNSLFLTDYFDPGEIHWQLSRAGKMHFATSPKGVEDLQTHNRRFYSDVFWDESKSGEWLMLAVTADRNAKQRPVVHYVNGQAIGISGGTNQTKPLPKMRFGSADFGNWTEPIFPNEQIRSLNGRVDEFGIYSSVLTASEIKAIYEEGKPY